MNGFDDIQKMSKDNMDLAMESFGAMTKGFQSISAEMADYSKKSFEDGSAAMEKIVAAKTLDKAFEAQSEFAKSAYETAISQATKFGEMYTDMAKSAYKPYEAVLGKAGK